MHIGKSYTLKEFLLWTRRNIYWLIIIGAIPVILYEVFSVKWIALPWTVAALLGTAAAFLIAFKNTQTYSRTWEARQIWGAIANNSRIWGTMSRDFLGANHPKTKEMIYRHLAWLTAMRYQMREPRPWENTSKHYNREYSRYYAVPEKGTLLNEELSKFLPDEELKYILTTKNRATQLMGLQSKTVNELYENKQIDGNQFYLMENVIKDLYENQGKSERIKNFPYPRQFATINTMFLRLFCIMLPFCMLNDFDQLNKHMNGFMEDHMVWLVIPFSVLISWVYTSLEQVGESTENPFEGGANDVPISQMSRNIEIDLREMLGETFLPQPLVPENNIIL